MKYAAMFVLVVGVIWVAAFHLCTASSLDDLRLRVLFEAVCV